MPAPSCGRPIRRRFARGTSAGPEPAEQRAIHAQPHRPPFLPRGLGGCPLARRRAPAIRGRNCGASSTGSVGPWRPDLASRTGRSLGRRTWFHARRVIEKDDNIRRCSSRTSSRVGPAAICYDYSGGTDSRAASATWRGEVKLVSPAPTTSWRRCEPRAWPCPSGWARARLPGQLQVLARRAGPTARRGGGDAPGFGPRAEKDAPSRPTVGLPHEREVAEVRLALCEARAQPVTLLPGILDVP